MILLKILRLYMYLHEIIHKRVISRLGCFIYGIHPKEIFGSRYKMFEMAVCDDDIVLDVACGSGSMLFNLSDNIKSGYGIDSSEKQIELCNKFHSDNNLMFEKTCIFTADYKKLKKEVGYNVAIFSHILEHVEDVKTLVSKVDADRILVCVPSNEHWYRQLMEAVGLDNRTDRGHFREYDMWMLVDQINDCGYDIEIVRYNSDGDLFCSATKR